MLALGVMSTVANCYSLCTVCTDLQSYCTLLCYCTIVFWIYDKAAVIASKLQCFDATVLLMDGIV